MDTNNIPNNSSNQISNNTSYSKQVSDLHNQIASHKERTDEHVKHHTYLSFLISFLAAFLIALLIYFAYMYFSQPKITEVSGTVSYYDKDGNQTTYQSLNEEGDYIEIKLDIKNKNGDTTWEIIGNDEDFLVESDKTNNGIKYTYVIPSTTNEYPITILSTHNNVHYFAKTRLNSFQPFTPIVDHSMVYWYDGTKLKQMEFLYNVENEDQLYYDDSRTDFAINDDAGNVIDTIPNRELYGIHFGDDWDGLTTVGDDFMEKLYANIQTTDLHPDSNFPSNITIVGNNFAYQMFFKTTIETLPDSFVFPQQITEVGNNFASEMFAKSKIKTLPTNFTMPQLITTVGDSYAESMFFGVTELNQLPTNFNLSQNIGPTVGDNFCKLMFSTSTIESMPTNFTMPQLITDVGDSYAESMFYKTHGSNSTPGFAINSAFNISQNIVTTGDNFCSGMFNYSSCDEFGSSFNLPQGITEVGKNFCDSMFSQSSFEKLPDNFNLPQNIANDDDGSGDEINISGFCQQMFSSSQLKYLPVGFTIPTDLTSSRLNINFFNEMFAGCSQLQHSSSAGDKLVLRYYQNGYYYFLKSTNGFSFENDSNNISDFPTPYKEDIRTRVTQNDFDTDTANYGPSRYIEVYIERNS